MASSTTSSSPTITIRVLVATTGVTYKISLLPSELTVGNIRSHLAAAVPLQDQILLMGPPYKVPKDSTLQSEEILNALRLGDEEDNPNLRQKKPLLSATNTAGARRMYLFSKQALSEQSPDSAPCQLEPMAFELPSEPPGPSPLNLPREPHQPLYQALAAYERQFMLYLAQGKVLADGADLRLSALRQCVQEQAVMCRALRAAVSNLSDHFAAAARTRAEFSVTFTSKTAAHSKLLQRFDNILNDLSTVRLHPSLVAIARASGRTMVTLLDTVPVERERAWAQQCNTSHQRLASLFRELDTAFGDLGTAADRQKEAKEDAQAEQEVEALWNEVDGNASQACLSQSKRLEQLTNAHREVVKVITNALSGDASEIQNAFSPLQGISSSSKDLVPSMIDDDQKLATLMERVSEAKTAAMKRMKVRLREVSVAQSSIQRVLASVGVLRDALSQQTDNMVHLEHVAELSDSYRHFLMEIQRRVAYGQAVTSSSLAMMERLAAMREDEVKAREKFLRGPGRHLMPAFYDSFVLTLATPPPLFTPQLPAMVELDTLPDISDLVLDAPVAASDTGGLTEGSSEMQQSVAAIPTAHSSESTLTVSAGEAQQQQGDTMMGTADKQHQQLIVSAEEGGANVILDPVTDAAATAASDAELKTLAYENAVLRQALERMGGKPPRVYIDEARKTNPEQIELSALRKELADANAAAKASQDALLAAKSADASGESDKISHSSLQIGDVGLFMPFGREFGGKRTYLAFHTYCPNRFLSSDCVEGRPDFILGRIVYQERLVAGEVGTAANPYGLRVGTQFYVLTVEVLHPTTASSG